MKLGNEARFALGMVLFSPLFLLEDGLRAAGMKDPGLVHNAKGESILGIWNQEGKVQEVKKELKAELAKLMAASGQEAIPTLESLMNRDTTANDRRADALVAQARAAGSMAKVVRSLVNDPDAILNPNSEISRRLAELGIVLKD